MKVGFVSLGCAKNMVDSQEIMGTIGSLGHEFVSDPRQADAIFVNTCGFINPAKQESIDTILEMTRYARTVVATGCLAQRYEDELRELIPELRAIIPIRDYGKLPEILPTLLDDSREMPFERVLEPGSKSAYVKISEGCSNRCAFCAIPLIRGNQKSKLIPEVKEEVQSLVSRGIREITLIAQDTTKYGVDRYGRRALPELIRELESIEGIRWIRILYMYPDEITDELLEAMRESKKVLPYFDIPMQHASNRLLRKMNRRGTKEEVRTLVSKIRTLFPEAVLRTTIIVGFPSETEEEFEELLDFVREIRWDRLGAFPYSKEEDTSAYAMTPEVDEETARQRYARLMETQRDISLELNRGRIGQDVEVLVEDRDALSGKYYGRWSGQAPDEVDGRVIFTSDAALSRGDFVPVRITDARQYDLVGIHESNPVPAEPVGSSGIEEV